MLQKILSPQKLSADIILLQILTFLKCYQSISRILRLPGQSSGLRLWASNARDMGLIPGWGTKIPHVVWHGQEHETFFFKYCQNKEYADETAESK